MNPMNAIPARGEALPDRGTTNAYAWSFRRGAANSRRKPLV
jgi:hypothetical protein